MRELKYRVIDEKYNKVYSNEEVDDDGGIIVTISDGKLIAFEISMAGDYRDLKLIEYTGLKDKNGVDIYEGDIFSHRYVVTYVDGSDGADLGMNVGFYEQRDNFESWSQLEVGQEYEVLGNIYENPELLNK